MTSNPRYYISLCITLSHKTKIYFYKQVIFIRYNFDDFIVEVKQIKKYRLKLIFTQNPLRLNEIVNEENVELIHGNKLNSIIIS
ncbi:hypothetical protein CWD77_07805 [Rhodohalobacter barkolensis]|uniref:Uncharacterized protein n=1 Tax=Rhodohalobacter barkolensis TaxID=2053187 RepID=A0A2N0VGZ6_9BACT|nr:hypothetical protein CWD77_07805 [Rhodohalobacter barkolensis]